jgi:PAS domain S-box-containing protein
LIAQLKKLKNISIKYKVYIPLICITIFGLSLTIVDSYYSLEKIERSAKDEVRKEFHSFVAAELDKEYQIALTNAINLSLNQNIIDALKNNNREEAYLVLNKLSGDFQKYNRANDVKIHLHNDQTQSFARSWTKQEYGDDLTSFRKSLAYVHKTKEPIVTTEIGRVGMAIRGIAPIFDGAIYLGSVEFIQDFDSLAVNAHKQNNFLVATFSNIALHKDIKKFATSQAFDNKTMTLAQSMAITDPLFYKALQKDFDKDIMMVSSFEKIGAYYVSNYPLYDVGKKNIGCVLIGAHEEYVHRSLTQAKEIFIGQIWIMVFADALMLVLLILLLDITVKKPIFKLKESVKNINAQIKGGKTPTQVYKKSRLTYTSHDEIGIIGATINSLLRTMSHTFIELQKSQKNSAEYLKAVYAAGLVSIGDKRGDITYVNEKFCEITGYTKEELLGEPHSILRDASTAKCVYKELWDTIESKKIYNSILKNRKKDGSTFYTHTTIVPIINEKDEIVEYIAFRDDITELIESKKKLKMRYYTSALTGLPNRFKMLVDVTDKSYLAIIDIHLFKEINDFYGYKIGDVVLQDFAQRVQNYFMKAGLNVYHLNGDEFAVVVKSEEMSQEIFLEKLKQFLLHNKNEEIVIDAKLAVSVRLTCGVAFGGDAIVNYADIAHKEAKKSNKDIVVYSDAINTDAEYKKNLEWSNELKSAIDEGRIQAYFQPIVNYKTSKIEKYETLMRLIKKDGEVVTPIHFLEIAKKTRMYKYLTKIVVTQAFEKFSDSAMTFSINLSIEDITTNSIDSWFFDLANEKGINKQLVIELVESEGIESYEAVNSFIQKAKEQGIRIAIDDFGTGYSNFEYLMKLNADFIKLDGSLIREIDTDEKLCSVVETIISFAQKNNIAVIGEFVATEAIYDKTIALGIEFGQGYYLGHPQAELQ